MATKEELKIRLEFHRVSANNLRVAYIALADGGVASYTIGSRSLTRLDLEKISAEIRQHEKDIDSLESQLNGGRRRKSVSVIPRDW